jgi:hypothetical protein
VEKRWGDNNITPTVEDEAASINHDTSLPVQSNALNDSGSAKPIVRPHPKSLPNQYRASNSPGDQAAVQLCHASEENQRGHLSSIRLLAMDYRSYPFLFTFLLLVFWEVDFT